MVVSFSWFASINAHKRGSNKIQFSSNFFSFEVHSVIYGLLICIYTVYSNNKNHEVFSWYYAVFCGRLGDEGSYSVSVWESYLVLCHWCPWRTPTVHWLYPPLHSPRHRAVEHNKNKLNTTERTQQKQVNYITGTQYLGVM